MSMKQGLFEGAATFLKNQGLLFIYGVCTHNIVFFGKHNPVLQPLFELSSLASIAVTKPKTKEV